MEYKKRDSNEEINLANIYVGLKTDGGVGITDNDFAPGFKINISALAFTVLEKMDNQIGIVGQEPVTIYKDLEEEKYSYVRPDGSVFTPSYSVQLIPSNHLSSVKYMRSYREVVNKLIELYKDKSSLDEETKTVLASFQSQENAMKEAEEKGGKATVRLGDVQSKLDGFVNLYCIAFGNPLEIEMPQDKESHRPMTAEEIAEQDRVTEARSKFSVVSGNGEQSVNKNK